MQNIELLMETYDDFISTTESYINTLLPHGETLDTLFPNFHLRIAYARSLAQHAQRRRAEMPVIEDVCINDLKQALINGGYASWCDECRIAPVNMRPYQCQIYVNKCVESTIKHGIEETKKFLSSSHLFVDKDERIIDGHHRWVSGLLVDMQTPLPVFKIRARIDDLMPLLLAFSDQHNERNL